MHAALTRISALTLCVGATGAHASPCEVIVEVAQESTAGTGDWDSNFLTLIKAIETTQTANGYYNWSSSTGTFGPPAGEPLPALDADTAHLFMVDGSDGASVFQVYDTNVLSLTVNAADTTWALSGDTAAYLAQDGPQSNQDQYTSNGTDFTTHHGWGNSKTDGFAIGILEGDWSMLVEIDSHVDLLDWVTISADGSRFSLGLTADRRVRLQPYACDADVDLDLDVDTDDLLEFTTMHLAGNPCADMDGDGDVDALDLVEYTTQYLAGC
ncbi:MAG: hypothetical protein DHS20C14_05780 [Phycisphaeraceae bacterium]|nr:MAG: hypothetical protein DHS20C14_05780 [Phycisphaeraceae bacterium]